MVRKNFSKDETKIIKTLLSLGKTNKEIARELNRSTSTVAVFVRRIFGGNSNYIKRISKHVHLRESVARYFLNHNEKETSHMFGLTASEFKSCMTAAYQMPSLKNLRKDTRKNHKKLWTVEEDILMLRMCGLLPRSRIADILDRGNNRVIKERLNKLNVSSRNINGLNLSRFIDVFGFNPKCTVQSFAGPSGKGIQFYFKQVLWVDIEKMVIEKKIKTHLPQRLFINTMASFQKWIWGGGNVRRKILLMLAKEKRDVIK